MSLTKHIKEATVLGIYPPTRSYTWATKPDIATMPTGTVISISDLGGDGGSLWRSTLAGYAPLNGELILASHWGTIASPVAPILVPATGVATPFVPSGGIGSLTFPAGLFVSSRSKLEIDAHFYKTGTAATAIFRCYFGSDATYTNNPVVFTQTSSAGTGSGIRANANVGFIDGNMNVTMALAPGAQGTTNTITDRTITLTSANILTFSMLTGTNPDAFSLIGYSIKLIQI